MIRWLRHWLAQPLLDEQRAELHAQYVSDTTLKQIEAYRLGEGTGRAVGQIEGQQAVLDRMASILDERHGQEITRDDIERARKGLLH